MKTIFFMAMFKTDVPHQESFPKPANSEKRGHIRLILCSVMAPSNGATSLATLAISVALTEIFCVTLLGC